MAFLSFQYYLHNKIMMISLKAKKKKNIKLAQMGFSVFLFFLEK